MGCKARVQMPCRCRVGNNAANPTPATPISAARILTVNKAEETTTMPHSLFLNDGIDCNF